jgi:hypothetical protein
MPSRRLSCSARWLSLPAWPDAGMLVTQHQGDGVEPGAQARRHAAAPDSRLDLADGPASTETTSPRWRAGCCFRGRHDDAGTALAWSSHRLLLWTPRHGRRGSMPHRPAGRARNVPGREPHPSNAEPTCGSPKIYAAGLRQALTGPRTRRWLRSGDDDTGIPPRTTDPPPNASPTSRPHRPLHSRPPECRPAAAGGCLAAAPKAGPPPREGCPPHDTNEARPPTRRLAPAAAPKGGPPHDRTRPGRRPKGRAPHDRTRPGPARRLRRPTTERGPAAARRLADPRPNEAPPPHGRRGRAHDRTRPAAPEGWPGLRPNGAGRRPKVARRPEGGRPPPEGGRPTAAEGWPVQRAGVPAAAAGVRAGQDKAKSPGYPRRVSRRMPGM